MILYIYIYIHDLFVFICIFVGPEPWSGNDWTSSNLTQRYWDMGFPPCMHLASYINMRPKNNLFLMDRISGGRETWTTGRLEIGRFNDFNGRFIFEYSPPRMPANRIPLFPLKKGGSILGGEKSVLGHWHIPLTKGLLSQWFSFFRLVGCVSVLECIYIPFPSRLSSLVEILGRDSSIFFVAARVACREEAGRIHGSLAEGGATFFAQGAIRWTTAGGANFLVCSCWAGRWAIHLCLYACILLQTC